MGRCRYRDTSMSVLISRRIGALWSRCRCCSSFSRERGRLSGDRCDRSAVADRLDGHRCAVRGRVACPAGAVWAGAVAFRGAAQSVQLGSGAGEVRPGRHGTNPEHESVQWSQAALRKVWNRAKDEVAPWWAQNSKEAYSTGLADLETALNNWSASKTGRRRADELGSPASSPRVATRIGCGSPPARCDWSPTGAPSSCRSSEGCGRRRTPAACSATSPPDAPGS